MGVCVCVVSIEPRFGKKLELCNSTEKPVGPPGGNTYRGRSLLSIGGWWRGIVVSGVRRMNEVIARQARLVLGWVTVFGRVYHLGM